MPLRGYVIANDLLPFESSENGEVVNMQCMKINGWDRTLMLKIFGPSADPCGVPQSTSQLSEYSFPNFTLSVQPDRNDRNQSSATSPMTISSFNICKSLLISIVYLSIEATFV